MSTIEKQQKVGDFLFRHIGKNHVVIFPHPDVYTNSGIPMTGSGVTKYIDIQYFHRLVKLVVIHLDSSYDKATGDMWVTLELEQGKSSISKKLADRVFRRARIKVSQYIKVFGMGFEYEAREWALTLTADNTDIVIPVLYIQKEAGS